VVSYSTKKATESLAKTTCSGNYIMTRYSKEACIDSTTCRQRRWPEHRFGQKTHPWSISISGIWIAAVWSWAACFAASDSPVICSHVPHLSWADCCSSFLVSMFHHFM